MRGLHRVMIALTTTSAIVALAGCAIAPARVQASSSPAPVPSVETFAMPDVDTASTPGVVRTTLVRTGGLRIHASLLHLSGASALDTRVDSLALTAIDDYLAAAGAPAYVPALPPLGLRMVPSDADRVGTPWERPELRARPLPGTGLDIQTRVVLASGPWLGLQVHAVTPTSNVLDETAYVDVTSGQALSAADLLAPDAGATLAAAALDVDGLPLKDGAWRALAFSDDGAVVLPSSKSDGATGEVSAERARPLLSDLGRAVQAAARSRTAFRGVPAGAASFAHVPCALIACAALTFDDGPSQSTTTGLLDLLDETRTPATFFVEGRWAREHPDLIQRQVAAGHAVESHTFDHPDLSTLSAEAIRDQIASTDAAIVAAGAPKPTLIRAPYGKVGGAVTSSVDRPLVYWSVDSFDWRDQDPTLIERRVLDGIAPGGIPLMHDIYPTTVAAQRSIIQTMRTRGYTLVTMPQLLEGQTLRPGSVVTCLGSGGSATGPVCSPSPVTRMR